MAAHITRLTRVKTNPLGNGMWNGNYRVASGGEGGARGEKGRNESEREEKKGDDRSEGERKKDPRPRVRFNDLLLAFGNISLHFYGLASGHAEINYFPSPEPRSARNSQLSRYARTA